MGEEINQYIDYYYSNSGRDMIEKVIEQNDKQNDKQNDAEIFFNIEENVVEVQHD